MQTDSSASRTWRLSRSAWLKTATVEILSSRHARMMRRAISPRFAIRTLRNMGLRLGHPVRRRRAEARRADLAARGGLATRRAALATRLDRRPLAVRGTHDALELEQQFVRLVAVLERILLRNQPVAQEAQHRLVERLHPVL